MQESGFYLLKDVYIDKINQWGGVYQDKKERPIYCCIEDRAIPGLYWAIPTSDPAHRTPQQMEKIRQYGALSHHDIRSNYYHIATTNRTAIFKISCALPVTEKYIEREYISKGRHLVLQDAQQKIAMRQKLLRILAYEGRFPNRFEQHITDLVKHLAVELEKEKSLPLSERLDIARKKCDQANLTQEQADKGKTHSEPER